MFLTQSSNKIRVGIVKGGENKIGGHKSHVFYQLHNRLLLRLSFSFRIHIFVCNLTAYFKDGKRFITHRSNETKGQI